MPLQIQWAGAGEPVLFIPGWNTSAAAVRSWIPEQFLARFRCGILEWPGLGTASGEPLPATMDALLDDLEASLAPRPVAVVGFCLGGIAAWAFAQRHPAAVRCSVLVESPLHFPAVLLPLLVPGLGSAVLHTAKGTPLGRCLVRRAILQRRIPYPAMFMQGLFAFKVPPALHYLRLFKNYGESLRRANGPLAGARPSWHLLGQEVTSALGFAWGARHRIHATPVELEGAGHFPAVEAPERFFGRIQELLFAS